MNYFTTMDSALGLITLTADEKSITGLKLPEQRHAVSIPPGSFEQQDTDILIAASQQLEEYFSGTRKAFNLPLNPRGTTFQHKVWQALHQIPFATTISYKDLARLIGSPNSIRAVGQANGRNPIAILIPCHRVVGTDGSLTGYGGGLVRKAALLDFEKAVLANGPRRLADMLAYDL